MIALAPHPGKSKVLLIVLGAGLLFSSLQLTLLALPVESFQASCCQVRRQSSPRSKLAKLSTRLVERSPQVNGDETPGLDVKKKSTDSLLRFSQDVEHVVHVLRPEENDPCIPPHLMGRDDSLSYSKTWTLADWERYNSRKRYFRYYLHFFSSRLVRRTFPQQLALLCWTLSYLFVDLKIAGMVRPPPIPLSALGTISTFLAFLLTLRSNTSLARLDEARRLWSKVVLNTREMSSLISAFVYPVDKKIAIMLVRHVAIFGWLLKSQLRSTRKDEVVDIVRTMLPNEFYKKDADYVLSQRQKTGAVVTRIRQVIAHFGKQHKLTTAEEIALDHTAHALSEAITSTGRIRASPIPTLYTSHTSRLLVFYLFCLPPALHMSGMGGIATTIVTMVVGYAMAGLDEISHLFEQPFRVIPMYQMSKRSMLAVADSLTCRPPPLEGEKEEEELPQKDLVTYWSTMDISSLSDNLME